LENRQGMKKINWMGSLLCILVFAGLSVAQDLGPHDINGQGCLSCHSTSNVDPSNVAATFLWGNFSQTTYTTYGGGVLSVGPGLTDQDPSFHSATCLSCHDGDVAESGSMPGSSLTADHPMNVPYPLGADEYWQGTVTTTGISFKPSHFDTVYGRPIRFYVSAGVAYIECASCHDPHNYSTATVVINGQTYTKPTAHFVRGWYDPSPTSNSVSQFCRSCHYGKSNEEFARTVPTY
jgi:hypothetical protein